MKPPPSDGDRSDTARADIAVVIAAKNEGRTVGDIVRACRRYANQILVVDGHSSDCTADAARAAGAELLSDGGRGKGAAVRTAIPHIRCAVTVFIDADGSHQIDDIPVIVGPILDGQADHVSASRILGGSSELHGGFDEFLRLSGSSFITACINWRFGVRLSDSQNGFRAIRTSVLQALPLRENHTTIEQEMIIKTLRLGYRMDERPSHEHRRIYGESHIKVLRSAPRYAWCLMRNLL
jgi:dolichol-phosphate mannosyltransferase